MKYLLKLLKKILSVAIIITLFNLLIPNTIISNGIYDEKILKSQKDIIDYFFYSNLLWQYSEHAGEPFPP